LALWEAMGVVDQRHSPAALPLGKEPDTHRTGGWVVPRNIYT
jgi:hypothetical protein